MNCLSGFYRPQQGDIIFSNQQVTGRSVHEIARAGLARTFQGTHVFPSLTVVENIMVGRHMHMRGSIAKAFIHVHWAQAEEARHREIAEEIIEFLEIETIRHQPVGSLGYGLRKRVDLGRALAQEPRVLLMDEPMAGMNNEEKEDLARFILDVREARDIPVVLIEHDMGVVMDLADRIYVLDFGRLIAVGTPDEVQRNPAVLKAYLGER
jgi:branched-chain amino acid transport system ATP-binding protein